MKAEGVGAVLLVSDGFRSYRDHLAYSAVLEPAGMVVRCNPVFNGATGESWISSPHGIQNISLQMVKLLYYRTFVIPRARHGLSLPSGG